MCDAIDIDGRPVSCSQRPTGRLLDDPQPRSPAGRLKLDSPGPTGVGHQRDAAADQRPGYDCGQGHGVVFLVEHIGGDHEVELAEFVWDPPPLEQSDSQV